MIYSGGGGIRVCDFPIGVVVYLVCDSAGKKISSQENEGPKFTSL